MQSRPAPEFRELDREFHPANRWFAIHTRYQHEQLATDILLNKGFEIFFPTYVAVHRWSDRKRRVTLPLFPGYLFFANDIDRRIEILATPGVSGIIKIGNVPAEVPSDEIAAIRRVVESELRAEPHPFVREGDRVRIKTGPLAGLEGFVSRKNGALRLILSVQMLGRSAAVEINGCAVERLNQAQSEARPYARDKSNNHPAAYQYPLQATSES